MTHSRRLPGLLVALFAIVLAASLSDSAHAQDQEALAMDIITADNLTGQQRNNIDSYVARHGGDLIAGEPAQLATARRALLAPWGVDDATAAFRQHYRAALAEQIDAALASDEVLVRLNGMILAARVELELDEPRLLELLADDSPAVRYWAAAAVRQLAASGRLGSTRQQALVAHLRPRIDAEADAAVLEQLLVALAALSPEHAAEPLLEALNARVAGHVEAPGRSVAPAHSAMQRLHRRLTEADNAPVAARVQLSRTALRYMDALAGALAEHELDASRQRQYARGVALTDHILRTMHSGLGGGGNPPGALTQAIEAGDWEAVRSAVGRWRTLLQQGPYNLDEADLAV